MVSLKIYPNVNSFYLLLLLMHSITEMTEKEKILIKNQLKAALSQEDEIYKIIIFGSFLNTKEPNDIDVAIFQNSKEIYLKLALKYRKLTREIAKIIPVDILPLKENSSGIFLNELKDGEIIYER
jgi:predicted nucleotidyltransferase